jgi:hypothetical protein
MLKRLHPIAGTLALLTILCFWLATLVSEAFGTPLQVAKVKILIPWGFLVLIPALAVTGLSGHRLGAKWRGPIVQVKRRRMPWIAANGLIVLVPSALFLAQRASTGTFDAAFYTVQTVELVAGAVNLVLLGLNLRDGLRMTGRLARPKG